MSDEEINPLKDLSDDALINAVSKLHLSHKRIFEEMNKVKSSAELFVHSEEFWDSLYVGNRYNTHIPLGSGSYSGLNMQAYVVNKSKIELEFTNIKSERMGLVFMKRD